MNAEKLIRAIGGISDKHIEEFSVVKPVFSTKTTWLKIASIAACIAILFSIVNIALNLLIGLSTMKLPKFRLVLSEMSITS